MPPVILLLIGEVHNLPEEERKHAFCRQGAARKSTGFIRKKCWIFRHPVPK